MPQKERKCKDMGHESLAMLAAQQTGKPFENLVCLPDDILFGMIQVPTVPEPLDVEPPLYPDGRFTPHRRGTKSAHLD